MDFFTAQDHARRNTGRWVVLLLLAIVSLIGVTTLVVAIALYMMGASGSQAQSVEQGVLTMLSWELLVAVAVGVLALGGVRGAVQAAPAASRRPCGGGSAGRPSDQPRHARSRRAADPECSRGDGHCLRDAGACGIRAGRGGDQRLCGRLSACRCGGGHYPRRHSAAHPR